MSQEQITSVDDIDELEEKAIRRARQQNPGRSWSVVAFSAAKIMEDLWSKQQASS